MDKLAISILYVEDEDYIRNNMVTSLKRRVETIYSASNGAEGLEMFKKCKPDLVITDIRMPVMSGLEMIKEIRLIKDNIKIIMLSAHSDTKSLMDAIEIGVNGYVLKPFKTKKLFSLIEDTAKSIILDKTVLEQSLKIKELYKSLVKDLETAGSVQEYLLPDYLIVHPELFFTSTYVPSTKIGGDLFDIIKISESHYIGYIGDISGHGVKAALLMTAVKTTINRIIEDEHIHEPHKILNRLSSILTRELFSSDYMTLLLCHINCEENYIKLLNAGHPPLIIYNKKDSSMKVYKPEGSIPIGWIPSYIYTPDEENTIEFNLDQIFFLYTDGLFECQDANGEELGIKGLEWFIKDSATKNPPATLPTKIRDALVKNNYDISGDDFTLVAFSRLPDKNSSDSLTTFSGKMPQELHLVAKKAAEFSKSCLNDPSMFEIIEKKFSSWLDDQFIQEEQYPEKDKNYLVRISEYNSTGIQIKLWAKHIELTSKLDTTNNKTISELLIDKLKVQLSSYQYDGFKEISILLETT